MFLGEPSSFHFFIFSFFCFHFIPFSFLLVYIFSCFHSSCYCFFRCFYSRLHLFTSLFLHCCCCYCECYGFERLSFTLRRFLSETPSKNLAPAFIKVFVGSIVQPWWLQVPKFETQILPICLFESLSVRQLYDK